MIRISRDIVISSALLLTMGIVYGFTLAPSVVEIDAGELAAVQYTLGIAHPTGYPLFTMLGFLFTRILFLRPIVQLNLLSLLYCLIGLVFFFMTVHRCLDRLDPDRRPIFGRSRPDLVKWLALCIGALFLAFSRTFWRQSTSVEVFPLHIALICGTLYFFVRAYLKPDPDRKDWLWGTVFLALGFTNHMTVLLAGPGLAFLFFKKEGFRISAFRRLAVLGGCFLIIVFIVTLYLPIRASSDPLFNWGNPRNLGNLLHHLTGKQYHVWLFTSIETAGRNLNRFISDLPSEFIWPGLLLALIGLYSILNIATPVGIFMVVCFLSTVLYSINYDIHDLDSYFLLAYIVIGIWISVGVRSILSLVGRSRLRWPIVVLLGILPLVQTIDHFPEADRSDCTLYEAYTRQALQSLPEKSLLLTYQWDILVSPAYYLQSVENVRSDVIVVDKELLRRSWYFHQLRTRFPEIIRPIEADIRPFLKALEPFETGGDFDADLLETLYRQLMTRLVRTYMETGPVYIAPELSQEELRRGEFILPEGVMLVPHLFFFQAVSTEGYVPLGEVDIEIPFPSRSDAYTEMVRNTVSRMLIWRALYELRFGKADEARRLRAAFIAHFPDLPLPPTLENL